MSRVTSYAHVRSIFVKCAERDVVEAAHRISRMLEPDPSFYPVTDRHKTQFILTRDGQWVLRDSSNHPWWILEHVGPGRYHGNAVSSLRALTVVLERFGRFQCEPCS